MRVLLVFEEGFDGTAPKNENQDTDHQDDGRHDNHRVVLFGPSLGLPDRVDVQQGHREGHAQKRATRARGQDVIDSENDQGQMQPLAVEVEQNEEEDHPQGNLIPESQLVAQQVRLPVTRGDFPAAFHLGVHVTERVVDHVDRTAIQKGGHRLSLVAEERKDHHPVKGSGQVEDVLGNTVAFVVEPLRILRMDDHAEDDGPDGKQVNRPEIEQPFLLFVGREQG